MQTTSTRPQSRPSPTAPADVPPVFSTRSFRPDIEGLRAVAVVAVVLFHLELGPFGGGFVGVDVFFVVSGYLITSLMAKEVATTGSLSLPAFWARRARRLLPASALVLVATVVASRLMLDPITEQNVFTDAFAAVFFVVNMVFAAGDPYFAVDTFKSPLLHFWSLAVEEQFYLFWPVMIAVIVRVSHRPWLVLRRLCVMGGAASLMLSMWLTNKAGTPQQWAFYSLPTRAWELGVGALIALGAGTVQQFTRQARAAAAWLGLVGIVVVVLTYREGSPAFPGWAAIFPVVFTGALVAASTGDQQVGPARLLGRPVMLWIGARSYAIYLWHWPIWVLGRQRWGEPSLAGKLLMVLLSLVLAELSFRLVENPIRHHRALVASPRRSLLLGGRIIAVSAWLVFAMVLVRPSLSSTSVAAAPTIPAISGAASTATSSSAIGAAVDPAASTQPTSTTAAPVQQLPVTSARSAEVAQLVQANLPTLEQATSTDDVPRNVRPSLGGAFEDKPSIYNNGCVVEIGDTRAPLCVFGDSGAAVHIVLFGDSHAAQWFPAFSAAAANNGWLLEVHVKRGCPSAEISLATFDAGDCADWRANVAARLEQVQPDLIVMTSYRYKPGAQDSGADSDQVWKRGLDSTLATFVPLADQVLILGDTPTPNDDVIPCLGANPTNASRCVRARGEAVKVGRLTVEAQLAEQFGVLFEPTSEWLCTESKCPVIIGDVLVYRDHNHITTTASAYLTPFVEATLRSALDR